jgi:Fe-S-cluster containining protein
VSESALTSSSRRLADHLFGDVFADEPRATCADCVMCRPPIVGAGLLEPYAASLKCCTYFPDLPNYLIGRTLRDYGGSEGAARLRAAIAGRLTTPLGLEANPAYARRYRERHDRFGRDASLLCPFYDEGRCTIWNNRNAVCQTFFCRFEQGIQGAQSWKMLTTLLLLAEERLAGEAVQALAPDALVHLYNEEGARLRTAQRTVRGQVAEDGAINVAFYTALWGEWQGREEDLFVRCADRVDRLDGADMHRIGGPALEGCAGRVTEALAARDATVAPLQLRPARPGVELNFEEQADGSPSRVSPPFWSRS